MLEFKGPKLTTKLICQAPMIHFQHYENGATLRASEVKPKFDRYIKAKEGWKDVPKEFRVDKDHEALNYKMRFVDEDCVWDSIDDVSFYYGNDFRSKIRRGEKYQEAIQRQQQEKGDKHLVTSNPTVTIVCFNKELQKKIIKYIESFFIVTNFGTMQSKGFGSFVLEESIEKSEAHTDYYEKIICENAELVADLYVMDTSGYMDTSGDKEDNQHDRIKKIFEDIKTFYQLTKSGLNYPFKERNNLSVYGQYYKKGYLFKYMLKKGLENEKALVKQKGIIKPFMRVKEGGSIRHEYIDKIEVNKLKDPIDNKKFKKQKENFSKDNTRYVRALLGVGSRLNFVNQDEKKTLKEKGEWKRVKDFERESTVTIENKSIERMASPLQFKIIENKIFILAKPIPDGIFEKNFTFKNDKKNNKCIEVMTPSKFEFNFADFLEKAINYYKKTNKIYRPLPVKVYINHHKKEETDEK